MRGIPAGAISQVLGHILSGCQGVPHLPMRINGQPYCTPLIPVLEVELDPVLLAKARSFGLSDRWVQVSAPLPLSPTNGSRSVLPSSGVLLVLLPEQCLACASFSLQGRGTTHVRGVAAGFEPTLQSPTLRLAVVGWPCVPLSCGGCGVVRRRLYRCSRRRTQSGARCCA